MRKFWKNHKGVTMVEVLVTVAILAIVVAPCLSAFVMAQRGNVKAAEAQAAYPALRACIGGHYDDGVFEIYHPALGVSDTTVIQHLQQDIQHIRVGLFQFIKQNDGIWFPAHLLG